MRPWGTLAIGLVVSLLVATPAAAQRGGLYEPFPEPAPTSQVRAFIAKLPGGGRRLEARTTTGELGRGAFPSSALRLHAGSREASSRAGVGTSAALLEGWPLALAAFAAAAGVGVAVQRRRA